MRGPVRLLLVFILASAGCATPASEVDGSAPTLPMEYVFAPVYDQEAYVPVPMDRARAAVPDGFEPAPYPADPTGASATLVFVIFHPEEGTGARAAFVLIPGTPPQGLRDHGANVAGILLAAFTDDAALATLLAQWGVETLHTSAFASTGGATAAVRTGDATLEADGHRIAITSAGPESTRQRPDEWAARVFTTRDGNITGALDFRPEAHLALSTATRVTLEAPGVLAPFAMRDAPGVGVHAFGAEGPTRIEYTPLG